MVNLRWALLPSGPGPLGQPQPTSDDLPGYVGNWQLLGEGSCGEDVRCVIDGALALHRNHANRLIHHILPCRAEALHDGPVTGGTPA